MKKVQLALGSLLAAFVLVGCQEIQGRFEATAPLVLKQKKETITLPPGEYRAEVSRNRKGSELEFQIRRGKQKHEVKLRLPEATRLPKEGGSFVLRAADTGQAWDVRGEMSQETAIGDLIHGHEPCTVQVNRGWCDRYGGRYPRRGDRYDPYDPYYDGWGRCSYTYHGFREVDFREVRTTTFVSLEFSDAQTDLTIGTFNGQRADVVRDYEFIGHCR